MNLKHNILAVMDRETLKAAVDELELEDIDRRSVEAMGAKLSRCHRATPELLLRHLSEKQVKAVCEECGVSSTGRRDSLVRALLGRLHGKTSKPIAGRQASSTAAARPRRNQRHKESKTMSEAKSNSNDRNGDETPVRLPDPPAGMVRVSKTELVWPGKYNDDGTLKEVPRVSLPFQVIETINESRATREASKKPQQASLFDVWEGKEGNTFEDGWRNTLIWGDNLLVMGSLLEKFAGKIDLIYIDPPFATGADFSFTTEVGDSGIEIEKEQSAIEEKAYRDTWGGGLSSFLPMLYERLVLIRALLSERGSLYVHIEPDTGNYLRPILDELFGDGCLRTEIAWKRTSSHGNVSKNFGEIWESIFYYT